jgi:hypothetical protein
VSCNQLIKSKSNRSSDTQYGNRIAYRILCKNISSIVTLFFLALGMVGCGNEPTPYRPPTIAVQPTRPIPATSIPTVVLQMTATQLPFSMPTCTDNLTFLEDLSLPDGTVVHPGDILDKRWLVENSGTCNWDEIYRLKFLSGADLDAPIEQALYPARSGAKATIRIEFTAPSVPGTYQSAWQAYDPQGLPFGDPIFIHIIVDSGQF